MQSLKLVAKIDDLAMYHVYISINKWRSSQTNSRENQLDHGAYGKDVVDASESSSHCIVFPGRVILNASIIVVVFAKTVEGATVNRVANVVCCRMQLAILG